MRPFSYVRVDSAEAAVKALVKAGPEARVIAGGTTLYDLMKLRATIGVAAFASEKQSDPIDPSLCEWPSEYFEGDICSRPGRRR